MAKAKKTKNEEVIDDVVKSQPLGSIALSQKKFEQCEWVFQFDEDEPQIFAWTSEDMSDEDPTVTFTIGNTMGAYISFKNKESGKMFKLFARELTEEGVKLREFQTSQIQLTKSNLENESENKEA